MDTISSFPARRPGTLMGCQVGAELAANDLWDVLHSPRPRRRPAVRRPGPHLTNPLAVLVRELPVAQFRAWRRYLTEAGIHPHDFADDVAGPETYAHVPFGRLLRYRDWLLARNYPDLLAPLLTAAPAGQLALAD